MISLADAKAHLRVTTTANDSYIRDLELAAVAYLEGPTKEFWRAEEAYTAFIIGSGSELLGNSTNRLWLPFRATISQPITVKERWLPGNDPVTIVDTDDSGFLIRPTPFESTKCACLIRKLGLAWYPGAEYEVGFTRGWPQPVSPDDSAELTVPYDIRRAALFLISWWYTQRVPALEGRVTTDVDNHLRNILGRWFRRPMGAA